MIDAKFNKVNTSTAEGKLLVAAIGMLTTASFNDKTPDEVLKHICEMANRIYYEDEIKLRDDIESLIISRINSIYYTAENTKSGNKAEMPESTSTKIKENIDILFKTLKETGLFSD